MFSDFNWNYSIHTGDFLVRQPAEQVICTVSMAKKIDKKTNILFWRIPIASICSVYAQEYVYWQLDVKTDRKS